MSKHHLTLTLLVFYHHCTFSPVQHQCRTLHWARPSDTQGSHWFQPHSRRLSPVSVASRCWGNEGAPEHRRRPGSGTGPSAGRPVAKTAGRERNQLHTVLAEPEHLSLLVYNIFDFILNSIWIAAVQITWYLKCTHLQHYSRKRRRAQVHNSPGCRQRCLRSLTTASDGKSSLIGGTRTGDSPQNTTCTPATKTHSNITGRHLIHSQIQALFKLF